MSEPAHQKLVKHWVAGGLKISPGCSERDVRRFEHENGIILPEDFRSYFLHVNGMLPDARNDCDENGFCFWTLENVKSVAKELALHASRIPTVADHQHFVFSDYFQWSWAYAIRLTDNPMDSNQVVLVCARNPKVVATSFTQFVELYLRDSKDLYPV